jgi:hypothetical protein
MDWYYAVGGNQLGPVAEAEFQRLVQQGVVTPQTLVWHEGLPDWRPYSGGALPPPPPGHNAVGEAVCAGCGRIFPRNEVIPLGGGLHCAACKPLTLQRIREGESASSAVEEMRKMHLKHEASVQSIGFLYYLGGAGVLLAGIIAVMGATGSRGGVDAFAGLFVAVILIVLGVGQIWVGTGLRRLRRWARIPTGILSGIGLLGFPVGTIINAYVLYLVFCQKGQIVFSDEYRAVIEQTPHIKYRTSIVVWILLGLVVALIGLGIIGLLTRGR